MLPTKFQLIWPIGFREDFLNWPITNKNCQMVAMFLFNLDEIRKSYREPPIDASCKI